MNEHLLTQCGTNYATYTNPMPTKLEDVALPKSKAIMLEINRLTPDVKGKAFDPDWFKLRETLEAQEKELHVTSEELRVEKQFLVEKNITANTFMNQVKKLQSELLLANQKCQLVNELVASLEHFVNGFDGRDLYHSSQCAALIGDWRECSCGTLKEYREARQALSKAAKTL